MSTVEGEIIEASNEEEKINTPLALKTNDGMIPLDTSNTDPRHVVSFNPLDAQPVAFKKNLVSRQENYDTLAMHLRGMLVPDKDFGRIHLANRKKCDKPWNCTYEQNPFHYSGYQLFAAGCDKILGMLGLAVHYPNEQDFIRAALTGKQIQDVIMKCHVLGHDQQIISEGMGACGRDEVQGSLNNAIKRACKRARSDAILRLPSISALFEDDFLGEVARQAANGQNSTSKRARKPKVNQFNCGAILTVMPLGKVGGEMRDKPFTELKDHHLEWILREMKDKPDIWNAAEREHKRRYPETNAADSDTQTQKTEPMAPKSEQSSDDWLAEYEGSAPPDSPPPTDFSDLEDADEWEQSQSNEATKGIPGC